jgi:uncharacterized protein (DUF58 family)
MHRPSGFDLHSVRDFQQGESLRRVHWRSTAKRGRLMVKELEDAPRDEVAVLLDARTGAPVFDLQVRAAGSILFAHASRNRRAVLVVNGIRTETVQTTASEGDRRRALELLAAAAVREISRCDDELRLDPLHEACKRPLDVRILVCTRVKIGNMEEPRVHDRTRL